MWMQCARSINICEKCCSQCTSADEVKCTLENCASGKHPIADVCLHPVTLSSI